MCFFVGLSRRACSWKRQLPKSPSRLSNRACKHSEKPAEVFARCERYTDCSYTDLARSLCSNTRESTFPAGSHNCRSQNASKYVYSTDAASCPLRGNNKASRLLSSSCILLRTSAVLRSKMSFTMSWPKLDGAFDEMQHDCRLSYAPTGSGVHQGVTDASGLVEPRPALGPGALSCHQEPQDIAWWFILRLLVLAGATACIASCTACHRARHTKDCVERLCVLLTANRLRRKVVGIPHKKLYVRLT